MFPPIPSWDGFHPLIVHFPIALLFVAPVLIVIGWLRPASAKAYYISALALMLIGTVSAYIAVATGEAAGELVTRTPAVSEALEEHEELAETTRMVFTILTIVFAAVVFGPGLLKGRIKRPVSVAAHAIFMLVFLGGTVLLANTAHEGGRLVHEFGVQAMVTPSAAAPTPATSQTQGAPEADDD